MHHLIYLVLLFAFFAILYCVHKFGIAAVEQDVEDKFSAYEDDAKSDLTAVETRVKADVAKVEPNVAKV